MNRWFLDENDIDIYLKCTDDVRWNYSTKELVRILNDLETKLGDMEQEQIKEMQEHQEAMKLADKTITNLVEDNRASQEWYKKQLAEKDDEITQRLVIQERDYNQDKISFAVEQLEKVKELILKECFEVSGKGVVVRYYAIYHIFDNQIKQLKEMK